MSSSDSESYSEEYISSSTDDDDYSTEEEEFDLLMKSPDCIKTTPITACSQKINESQIPKVAGIPKLSAVRITFSGPLTLSAHTTINLEEHSHMREHPLFLPDSHGTCIVSAPRKGVYTLCVNVAILKTTRRATTAHTIIKFDAPTGKPAIYAFPCTKKSYAYLVLQKNAQQHINVLSFSIRPPPINLKDIIQDQFIDDISALI